MGPEWALLTAPTKNGARGRRCWGNEHFRGEAAPGFEPGVEVLQTSILGL